MRFLKFCNAAMLVMLVSGCCGNVDVSSLPCYKETFVDSKETVQKREYELDKKRAPRYNL